MLSSQMTQFVSKTWSSSDNMGSILEGLRRERLATRKYSRNSYVAFKNDSLFIVILASFIGSTRYTNKCMFAGIFFFFWWGRFFSSWRTLKNLQHKRKGKKFRSPEPRKHWVCVEAQCNSPERWRLVFLRASCLGKLSMLVSSGID